MYKIGETLKYNKKLRFNSRLRNNSLKFFIMDNYSH